MSRIEQIKVEQKKLADELESEMLQFCVALCVSVNSAPNKNKHLQEV